MRLATLVPVRLKFNGGGLAAFQKTPRPLDLGRWQRSCGWLWQTWVQILSYSPLLTEHRCLFQHQLRCFGLHVRPIGNFVAKALKSLQGGLFDGVFGDAGHEESSFS